MDWVGASVIAPRPHEPIEFEVTMLAGALTGYFHDSRFFSAGDLTGYPRKLVRRWRYVSEASVDAPEARAAAR